MKTIKTSTGSTVSFHVAGSGPPLVLVHGAFSDHETNWTFVASLLQQRFRVYAIARRGRGATDATENHTLEDEARDVADVVGSIGAPVFLLGHSYGAHCALLAAALLRERSEPAPTEARSAEALTGERQRAGLPRRAAPRPLPANEVSRPWDRVRKLVLYEPAWPHAIKPDALAALEALAAANAWDQFAFAFFANTLHVPTGELETLRGSELWLPIVSDARASLGDLRAIRAYRFDPGRFADLDIPVMLQIGSESPRDLYVTDTLAAVLPDARIDTLAGQAHEAMTTAPELYARATMRFLVAGVDNARHAGGV